MVLNQKMIYQVAKIYLNRIEEIVKVPIKFIGTGPDREDMIIC